MPWYVLIGSEISQSGGVGLSKTIMYVQQSFLFRQMEHIKWYLFLCLEFNDTRLCRSKVERSVKGFTIYIRELGVDILISWI
jgi:hypothetical protein